MDIIFPMVNSSKEMSSHTNPSPDPLPPEKIPLENISIFPNNQYYM